MELTEPIESINQQLIDLYGIDTVTGAPMWRVVFSEDQLEKRLMDVTDEGFTLLVPEVREVPKYRQWIVEKYVLERMIVVPEINRKELADVKTSYEPLHVFENKAGKYLPPRVDVCKIVIDAVYAAQGKRSMARYVDDYKKYTPEEQEKKINELMEYLWDPSENADSIVGGSGIVVPSNYKH